MKDTNNTLEDEYIIPPFTILDARVKRWRDRKRKWREWIGETDETREGVLYSNLSYRFPSLYASTKEDRVKSGETFEEYVRRNYTGEQLAELEKKRTYNGTSSVDPVLSEICYKWFLPGDGCAIFDPFAGGVAEGAVACRCGHHFLGIDIRKEQIDANEEKTHELGIDARYINGDARKCDSLIGMATQDLLISCPPYFNLQRYGDDANDAANQPDYPSFLNFMREAFSSAIKSLKYGRFAVVIVGDVRSKNGGCLNYPDEIINIFRDNGCILWNDMVFVSHDPTAGMRARRYMSSRKAVRTHQRVLVFFKGKGSDIKKEFGRLPHTIEL